jgi:hypothetical protein
MTQLLGILIFLSSSKGKESILLQETEEEKGFDKIERTSCLGGNSGNWKTTSLP